MDFRTAIQMVARPIDSVQSVSQGWSTELKELSMYSEEKFGRKVCIWYPN